MTNSKKPTYVLDQIILDSFIYLNDLRLSGITNMFGARPYLMNRFSHLTSTEAKLHLVLWMSNFDNDPRNYKLNMELKKS